MTQRFDRTNTGEKRHYQSLCALQHYDFNLAGAHSYEQALQAIKLLKLAVDDIEQQVRRAFFNLVARNQDDHVKNIGFVMNKEGQWRLSPAFDVTYSYNPSGSWTAQHQMSLNGKRDGFDLDDLIAFGEVAGFKARKTKVFVSEIVDVVKQWSDFAAQAAVRDEHVNNIQRSLRVDEFN